MKRKASNVEHLVCLVDWAGVLAWVQATQPNAWEVLLGNHGDAAGTTLLSRLRDSLDKRGTLYALRNGFDLLWLRSKIKMAQFKPALAMNSDIISRYSAIHCSFSNLI